MGAAKTVSVRELKAHASEILRELEKTGEVWVTVRGRPVARLAALNLPARPKIDGTGSTRGIWAGDPPGAWEDFMEAKRIWEFKPWPDD